MSAPERLGEMLAAELRGGGESLEVRVDGRATGGLSQESWFVTLRGGEGERQAVLRLPTASSGPRAIVVQRAALELTAGSGVPVPGLIAHDDDGENALGRPFLLMERALGEIPTGWNDVEPGRRAVLAEAAMGVLAELRRVEWEPALPAIKRPPEDPAAAELAFYRKRLAGLGVGDRGTVEAALRWLGANLPPPAPPVLVHNDFRMGNFVVAGERIVAVLDWELARVGHPISDLAWCFVSVWDVPDLDVAAMFRRYAELTDAELVPETIRWYTALAYLRLVYYSLAAGAAFSERGSGDLRQACVRLEAPLRMDRLLRTILGEPLA